jgi:predicted oxidoreductase (fatty acid repression mutant protein)
MKQNRRTYYGLTDKSTLSNEQLTALVGRAVKFAPTSFNMQQNRVLIVTGEKHRQVWDRIVEAQKANDPSTFFISYMESELIE